MSNLIYNDVYVLMSDILRSTESSDIEKKTRAINEGTKQLIERMANNARAPGALLVQNEDLANDANSNTVDLPDNHVKLQRLYKKSGDQFLLLTDSEFTTLENLQKDYDGSFLDTSNTSNEISAAAMDDDKIYFDIHFSASGTDNVRIWYWKYMSEIAATDTMSISSLSGDFTVGETITGGTSEATAIVVSNTSSLVTVKSAGQNTNNFISGETITGGTSSETATTTSVLSKKTQELELNGKYKLALAESGATLFLHMDGSIESEEKDNILDNIVKQLGMINRQGNIRIRPGIY